MGYPELDGMNRRQFLQQVSAVLAAPMLPVGMHFGLAAPQAFTASQASAGGPANPSWKIVMVSPDEPGEPLVVTGTVYASDGRTPVLGARLYVYHTDARGYYSVGGKNERQPRLRGWMKTNAQGQYEFRTVKPASYPGRRNPAHIHATLAAPGQPEQWIDDFHFEGDPFLSKAEISRNADQGRFSSILKPKRDADGVLRGVRDLRVPRA